MVEVTTANHEYIKTKTGTPISYMVNYPNVHLNMYPSGSAMSYHVSMCKVRKLFSTEAKLVCQKAVGCYAVTGVKIASMNETGE